MRTKLLLTTAYVAGLTAMAQVYSVNVVGYINISCNPGFTMIANQLDNLQGNKISDLLPSGLPDMTTLYKFNGASYDVATFYVQGAESAWDMPDMTLNPGEGAYILNPNTTGAITLTFVGEVKQGHLVTPLRQGFTIASSQVPQSAVLTKDSTMPAGTPDLAMPNADMDTVYMFHNATKSYSIHTWYVQGAQTAWDDPPTPAVGDSFWTLKAAAVDWARDFTVPQ